MKLLLLLLFICSCGSSDSEENVTLSSPPTQEELCKLQSFMLGHGYVLSAKTLVLPREFMPPIDNPFENCN